MFTLSIKPAWVMGLCGLIFCIGPATAADFGFVIIAAPTVGKASVSRQAIARIFERKQLYWENNKRVVPINLPVNNPLRRAFSQTILGQAPEAMEDYWREMYFHGVLPPYVVDSEEAVIAFVAGTPGAIGYVSSCVVDHQVTVLLIVGEAADCGR